MMENYSSCDYNAALSKGNQMKFFTDNRWYKTDFLGYEGAAEYVCSALLAQTNIADFVHYTLERIDVKNKIHNGCASENFLKEGETLVTADRLFKKYRNISIGAKLEKMGTAQAISYFVAEVESITGIKEYGKYLATMLDWDAFVLNEDRHFNNIAFIHDGAIYRPAPLFDNGAALLSDTKEDYPISGNVYGLIANVSAKPFNKDFQKQVEIAKGLYGSDLRIASTIQIPQEVNSKVQEYYGTVISSRIGEIFQHQRFVSDIPYIKEMDDLEK